MSVQKAQATRTVTFIPNNPGLILNLLCNRGDLYQRYTGPAASTTNIQPQFTPQDPAIVTVNLISSDPNTALDLTQASVKWFLGNAEIPFTADGKGQGNYAIFQKTQPTSSSPNTSVTLKITGNLVGLLNGGSSILRCEVTMFTPDGSERVVAATLPVSIYQSTGTDFFISIRGKGGVPMVITEKGGKLTLEVAAFQGLSPLPLGSDYTIDWYKNLDTKPVTSATLDIQEVDVNSSMAVRAVLKKGTDELAMDVATVYDNTDPLIIEPNPSPADETINAKNGSNAKVSYSPVLVDSKTGNPVADAHQFECYVFGPLGMSSAIQAPKTIQKGGSFDVTLNDCHQYGSPTVMISAVTTS